VTRGAAFSYQPSAVSDQLSAVSYQLSAITFATEALIVPACGVKLTADGYAEFTLLKAIPGLS
jgi:hypothetical protein